MLSVSIRIDDILLQGSCVTNDVNFYCKCCIEKKNNVDFREPYFDMISASLMKLRTGKIN